MSVTATSYQLAATWPSPPRNAGSLHVDIHGGRHGRCEETKHSGDLGGDIGISNLSCYSSGLMGYHTPNIDRLANEGIRFTDSYGEQSCTAGRSSFITGQSCFRRPVQGWHTWLTDRPAGRGSDDRRAAQATRLRDGAVRQESPRRPE